jgi:CRISPR-associated protein Cas2
MCEIGPGVYTAPRMDTAVRERVWAVVAAWCALEQELSVVMTWPDTKLPGGQAVRTLGTPPVELVERDGVFLARRELTQDDVRSLTTRFGGRLPRESGEATVVTAPTTGGAGEDP